MAVVAAAGSGRRLVSLAPDGDKLALAFGASTLLETTLTALRRGGVSRLIAVVAPGAGSVGVAAHRGGAEVVVNPDPSRGMSSSLLAGVAAAIGQFAGQPAPEVFLLLPGDLPLLRPATVAALLARFSVDRPGLLVPRLTEPPGRRGHPLLLRADQAWMLDQLDRPRSLSSPTPPRAGLRGLYDLLADQLIELPSDDPGILRDVDTPHDYSRLMDGS